ncbi:MAG: hypothetical protein WKF34_00515 [Pyrinomonadaceae bacterium]
MRRTHFIFGVLLFIVFAITGRYMRVDFPDKEIIPQDLRLLMRSRHIYILFSALIHLMIGVYMVLRPRLLQKAIQITGSAVLGISSVVLVWAWYAETYQTGQFSNVSREGIYLSLTAVVLHMIGGFELDRRDEELDN